MKRRLASLLVLTLTFGGFAVPCSCMDCRCGKEVAAERGENCPACRKAIENEPPSCCRAEAPKEHSCKSIPDACEDKPCACGGEGSRDRDSTAPHSGSEVLNQIQFATSLPPSPFEILCGSPTRELGSSQAPPSRLSNLPIYLTTHSILC